MQGNMISLGVKQKRSAVTKRLVVNTKAIYVAKQLIMYVALIGMTAFGLRCIHLEKENQQYKAAFAELKTYKDIHNASFKVIEENPMASVNWFKDQIERSKDIMVEAEKVAEYNQELETRMNNLVTDMKEMDLQNASLIASNQAYYDELEAFRARQKLYDKYEFALYNNRGTRNDITFDQLKTCDKLLAKNGIDPRLLFGLTSAESGGDEDAKNPNSTATGHGQILESTGRSVYEKIMGNPKGSFKYSMLLDGDVNLRIASEYLIYLKNRSSSVYEIIDKYAGGKSQAYYDKLDSYLKKGGTSLEELDKQIYHSSEKITPTIDDSVRIMIVPDVAE